MRVLLMAAWLTWRPQEVLARRAVTETNVFSNGMNEKVSLMEELLCPVAMLYS